MERRCNTVATRTVRAKTSEELAAHELCTLIEVCSASAEEARESGESGDGALDAPEQEASAHSAARRVRTRGRRALRVI